MALIDEVMPEFDRREVHRRVIGAPPAATWDALRELTGGEMRLMQGVMGLRSLGRRRADGSRTVLEGFKRMGFRPVAEDPGRELVVAGIGRFWTPAGGLRKVEGAAVFVASSGRGMRRAPPGGRRRRALLAPVGRPAQGRGGRVFRRFEEPGYAKVAFNFLLAGDQ